jgi:RNA polymerase sigma-70 factor (ECF subfamily)
MAERTVEVARWLGAARAGSSDALGAALEACRGYLLLIAEQELCTELRAKGGASDLVQETFLKAHRHFPRFRGTEEAELLRWLRRIMLNSLVDFQRQFAETEKRRTVREVAVEAADSTYQPRSPLPTSDPSPSAVVMERERDEQLHRVLARLPDDYRLSLRLRHEEELSFEEIGRRMNRSANAARKLWARALERLQDEWDASP